MIGWGLILIHKLYGFVLSYEKSMSLGLMMNPTGPLWALVQKMSTQQLVVSLIEFPWKDQWKLVVLELFQEMFYSH